MLEEQKVQGAKGLNSKRYKEQKVRRAIGQRAKVTKSKKSESNRVREQLDSKEQNVKEQKA